MTRVAVFIDYQNVYKGARKAFGLDSATFTEGQVFPLRLGILLADRGRSIDPGRHLEYVRVCRGEPSPKHSAVGQAACQRQVMFWKSQNRVYPWTRPLHYYHRGVDALGEPIYEAREKGVDVRLAVDLVLGAVNDQYDVAVLCSGDSDLVPAVESVIASGKRCEVMGWRTKTTWSPRIRLPNRNVWCHWLDRSDYAKVHDPLDYTREHPLPAGPPG